MDPAWDMPTLNWQPQGSFEVPVTPTLEGPEGGVQVCIPPFNAEYLPLVLGCLDQLRIPKTWNTTDPDILALVLARVDTLREVFSMAGPCCDTSMRLNSQCVLQYSKDGGTTWLDVTDWVDNFGNCVRANLPPPVPTNPPGSPPADEACNIATWLGTQILVKAAAQQVANRDAGNVESNLVANLISAVFNNNPLINFLTEATNVLYQESQPHPNADLSAASTDATLQADLICAIFGAIHAVGYVDSTNFAQCATNIAAVSYPAHAWVPTMLGNFWNSLGLGAIQIMQSEGTVTNGDCGDCSGAAWCHYFDFTIGDNGFGAYFTGASASVYTGGAGWQSVIIGPAIDSCTIYVDMGRTANITEVQVQYGSLSGDTAGHTPTCSVQDVLRVHEVCSDPITFVRQTPGVRWDSSHPACSGRYVVIDLPGASGFGEPNTTITGVQIRGTGVNPFGFENCVVGP